MSDPLKQHELLFHNPVPGTARCDQGYALRWSGTAVMGILNVTPDSFSDGGKYYALEAARKAALEMLEGGAFVLDVGGESTRPGAELVTAEEELGRVLPLIENLHRDTDALISIDTSKPEVAQRALEAGAHIVNDVTGLRDPDMVRVCAEAGVPAVIMHMQGEPRTMQHSPSYSDVVTEVRNFLKTQRDKVLAEGVPSVVLDPGFGFGKTVEHNLRLVRNLECLVKLGHPVLLGASRKRSIDKLSPSNAPAERDPGSLALHLFAAQQGAAVVRVHDVSAHAQALRVWRALHDQRFRTGDGCGQVYG